MDDNYCRSIIDFAWDAEDGFHLNTDYLMRTGDLGLTWSPIFTNQGEWLKKIALIPSTPHIFVIEEYDIGKSINEVDIMTRIYHTTDEGAHWSTIVNSMPWSVEHMQDFGTGEAFLYGRRALFSFKKNSRFGTKILGKAQLYKSEDLGQT